MAFWHQRTFIVESNFTEKTFLAKYKSVWKLLNFNIIST